VQPYDRHAEPAASAALHFLTQFLPTARFVPFLSVSFRGAVFFEQKIALPVDTKTNIRGCLTRKFHLTNCASSSRVGCMKVAEI